MAAGYCLRDGCNPYLFNVPFNKLEHQGTETSPGCEIPRHTSQDVFCVSLAGNCSVCAIVTAHLAGYVSASRLAPGSPNTRLFMTFFYNLSLTSIVFLIRAVNI